MKSRYILSRSAAWLGALILVFCCLALFAGAAQKMKPEELVDKHLVSVGTAEARTAARNRAVAGDVTVTFRLGASGQLSGKESIFSDGRVVRLEMSFNSTEYPGELFAFDDSKVTVGMIRPGVRSRLSDFVYTYSTLLSEGLLGGTLSTAWPLLDLGARQPRLEYSGLKKIEGRQLHELKYVPKKSGGDSKVTLYFETESFRHVRSQYLVIVPETMARLPQASSQQSNTVYKLVETFDNFKTIDGLTMPHAYSLDFTVSGGQQASFMAGWNLAVTQLLHNK